MKFTRDGAVWTASFFSSVLTFLCEQMGLLHRAFPSLTDSGQAKIAMAAALVGFVSGWLKMSPLALSASHPLAIDKETASVALSPVNSSKPL